MKIVLRFLTWLFRSRCDVCGVTVDSNGNSPICSHSFSKPSVLPAQQQELLDALNLILCHSKPININTFNVIIDGKTKSSFIQLEKNCKKVTIRLKDYKDNKSGWCTSTMGLISTITRILINKSLMAVLDDNDNIVQFSFYEP